MDYEEAPIMDETEKLVAGRVALLRDQNRAAGPGRAGARPYRAEMGVDPSL